MRFGQYFTATATLASMAVAAPAQKRQEVGHVVDNANKQAMDVADHSGDAVKQTQSMGESAMEVPAQMPKRQAGGLPVPSLDQLSSIQNQLGQLLKGLGLPLSGGDGTSGGASSGSAGQDPASGKPTPPSGGTAGPAVHKRDGDNSPMEDMGKALDDIADAFDSGGTEDKKTTEASNAEP